MRTQRKVRPSQPETNKLTAQSGSQLVCVGHRSHHHRRTRYKMTEIMARQLEVVDIVRNPQTTM